MQNFLKCSSMGFTTRIKKRGIMAKTISQAGNPKTKL